MFIFTLKSLQSLSIKKRICILYNIYKETREYRSENGGYTTIMIQVEEQHFLLKDTEKVSYFLHLYLK